jgi:molybdopterin-guanine dinucleotide biosynthesis protein
MNSYSALTQLEEAVSRQIAFGGTDPSVESAGRAILAILEPTVRQIVLELAQQAANETSAQLPDYEIDVIVAEGEPELHVRAIEAVGETTGSYEARLTLRLPDTVKEMVENAAAGAGDSVNSWVVKTLSSKAHVRQTGKKVTGTVDL